MKYTYFVCYQATSIADARVSQLRTEYITLDYPLDSVRNVEQFKLWMEENSPKSIAVYYLVSFSLLNAEEG